MSSDATIQFFLLIAVLLISARALGELARRWGQPAILGELAAGFLLGPSGLQNLFPDQNWSLFEATPQMSGFLSLGVVLFLFTSGLEISLDKAWRYRRVAGAVTLAGILVPFALGLTAAYLQPTALGYEGQTSALIFAFFLATALSISALPVIAKTLQDLGLFQTSVGLITMSAAVIEDFMGWSIFACLLGASGVGNHFLPVWVTVVLTCALVAGMLTIGVKALRLPLKILQERSESLILSACAAIALVSAALTEWLGMHALFGAFIAGLMVSGTGALNAPAERSLRGFILSFLAPVFFASIGLRLDFRTHFDLPLVVYILTIACAGKILGCAGAARLSGLRGREAWAIGWCMNSRGSMGIILGLLAKQNGMIGDRLFVALVAMSVVTSALTGPVVKWLALRGPLDHRPEALV